MKVTAICIGQAGKLPGKSAKTGIRKAEVTAAVLVDRHGLVGDSICNRKHHGGPDQAVYGLGSVDLSAWEEELGMTLPPGTFGENLIIEGVDSRSIRVGDRFETAEVLLEVTATRTPCSTLSERMGDPHFARRFNAVARPGFYCRVLRQGLLQAGDAVTCQPFAGPSVTMPELLHLRPGRLSDEDRSRYLSLPIGERLRALIAG